DWSSDVCSSDLVREDLPQGDGRRRREEGGGHRRLRGSGHVRRQLRPDRQVLSAVAGGTARARSRKKHPERRMSLGEHLVALPKRLTRGALAVLGGTIIGCMIYDLGWVGELLEPSVPGAGEALRGQGTWAAISGPVFEIAAELGIDAERITLNFGTLTGALDIQFQ